MPKSQPNTNMHWLHAQLFQEAFSDIRIPPQTHTPPFKSTCSQMKEAATLVYVTYIFPRALFPLHKASYLAGDITAWVINAVYSQLHLKFSMVLSMVTWLCFCFPDSIYVCKCIHMDTAFLQGGADTQWTCAYLNTCNSKSVWVHYK